MDPKSKETQQELFEQFSQEPKKAERFPGLPRSQKPILLSTNTEQLLMGGILVILLLCGVFFLGVLRGKSIVRSALTSSRTIQASPAAPTIETHQKRSQTTPAVSPTISMAPERAQNPGPAAVEASAKPYTIQLVTHRKKSLAEAEMAALQQMGFTSSIIPSGEYFQVCAGQYASKEEAKKDQARFSSKYKDCFLRRR